MQNQSKVLVLALSAAVVVSGVIAFEVFAPSAPSGAPVCSPSVVLGDGTYCTENVTVTSCAGSNCPIPPPGVTFRGVLFQFFLFPSEGAAGLYVWVTEASHPNESASFTLNGNPVLGGLQQWNSTDRQVFVEWSSPFYMTNPNGTITAGVLCGVLRT